MAGKYPIASNADGTVRWSDGSTSGGMSTPQGYVSSSRVPSTSMSTSNTGYQTPSAPAPTSQPTQQSSGGGSSAPDLSNPAKQTDYAHSKGFDNYDQYLNSMKQNLQPDTAAIDAIYDPVNSYLSQQEQTISGQQPSVLEAAQNAYNTNLSTLTSSRERGEQQLGEQGIQAQQGKINAEDQSRRLYNELSRGGIQRFGGATSAGQGYGELLGVEQQRTQAQTAQQYITAKREIDTAKYNLTQDFDNKKMQLQQQKQEAENNIRIEFENRLMEIKGMKAQAASEKAAAQLGALQDMKNKMYQLDVANMQYQQQLQMQTQQASALISSAEQNLASYLQSGGNAASTMSDRSGQIGTGLTMNNSSQYTPMESQYVGRIGNQTKEDQLGQYMPLGRTLSF